MELSTHELWSQTLTKLRTDGYAYQAAKLSEEVRPIAFEEGRLSLGFRDKFFQQWVIESCEEALLDAVSAVGNRQIALTYEMISSSMEIPAVSAVVEEAPREQSRLNHRFTFETYVVADSNQLPAAAAAAVADAPGKNYNPLFIYGGTGLGKTHLLHSVGNRILQKNPTARIFYLSSEEFTNAYIESVRHNRMPEFRKKFREQCDVLLIDDVQFLSGKQETQNEFFFTFNALHQMSKAIVMTSDMEPSEIKGLEERLRSRFKMGLITDVQEPNFEMRVAILKKKAASDGFDLPDNVAHFIARHVLKNVRELEGALIKVAAVHSLTRQPITEEFAAQVLKDVLPAQHKIDVEQIQREVSRYFKVSLEDLKSPKRTREIVHARHVGMYLSRHLTADSYPQIARSFGGKDHTTAIAGIRKIETMKETNEQLKRELEEITERLSGV